MTKLYKDLKKQGILMEHQYPEAFCDTFGIPYERKTPQISSQQERRALQEFNKLKEYSRVKQITGQ